MPTIKKRLNIILGPKMGAALTRISQREQIPRASVAARLLERALEVEEDEIWDALAGARDTEQAKLISHARAWKT